MKKKTRIIRDIFMIVAGAAMLIAFIVIGNNDKDKKPETKKDNIKFAEEYTSVDEDNVFVYRDIDEIIDILKNGTGIVYLGFPECPWCQAYVKLLNEVALENKVDKIYYFNIKEDRSNDTKKYQEIVSLLGDNLLNDDEGKPRIFVPDVTGVKNGKIVGHDNETSLDTKGFEKPDDYWTDENVNSLKKRLTEIIRKVNVQVCTDCNK